jgi:anti-anti-sigma factor
MQGSSEAPVIVHVYQNIFLLKIDKDRLLEMNTINAVADAINKQIEMHPKISLVLDMGSVTNMSSAMIGKFVAIHKLIKKYKGRMVICDMKPPIFELFKMTKLHKVFEIKGKSEDAINYYKRKPL